MAPGIKVPDGYGAHFKSFDGKERNFLAEGNGGPSWYTEYNVLEGLSARSFGDFSFFVTRIAAHHVYRGLPAALERCGYRTFSLYPALGAFMSARSYQTTTGVEHFYDRNDLKADAVEPDSFFYDKAEKIIEREHGSSPMFVYIYLDANHFPWNYRLRPDLLPQWKDPGNGALVDEYLRRQELSAQNYQAFLAQLKRQFPYNSFLLVRYGDHQPDLSQHILEPGLDEAAVERQSRLGIRAISRPITRSMPSTSRPSTFPPHSIRSKVLTCPWSCKRPRACRSIRHSPSRKKSCSVATDCSMAATMAQRRAASIAC